MFRTQLATNYLKRTIRPLYGWTQATPKSGYLDPAWDRSKAIYPGYALTKTQGNNYTLIGSGGGTALNNQPAGLVGQFIGGAGIDELLESGVNALSVWVLGPDAEFEILAPAFDNLTGGTWSSADEAVPGVDTLVYAYISGPNQGQLCLATATGTGAGSVCGSVPVARLIQVESTNSIIIGGLRGTF
jgi:hypothetical protein